MDNIYILLVVLLDLSNAFDTVDHILLKILIEAYDLHRKKLYRQ